MPALSRRRDRRHGEAQGRAGHRPRRPSGGAVHPGPAQVRLPVRPRPAAPPARRTGPGRQLPLLALQHQYRAPHRGHVPRCRRRPARCRGNAPPAALVAALHNNPRILFENSCYFCYRTTFVRGAARGVNPILAGDWQCRPRRRLSSAGFVEGRRR
ncbi:hypothetical protein MTBUT4_280021 [Magnetospirillum sp. UT-4]|nr:hypothetical protein MTBUT4_280021 [Magnetospirillum sp. UT-4]